MVGAFSATFCACSWCFKLQIWWYLTKVHLIIFLSSCFEGLTSLAVRLNYATSPGSRRNMCSGFSLLKWTARFKGNKPPLKLFYLLSVCLMTSSVMCLDKLPLNTKVQWQNPAVLLWRLLPLLNVLNSHFLRWRGYHKTSVRLRTIFFSIQLLKKNGERV